MLKTRFMHFGSRNGWNMALAMIIRPSEYDQNVYIKSLCYQRINCKTFFKFWSEKCKMLCYINHDILVTMVTKRTRWPPLFLVKIHVWYSKGVFVPNLRKIHGVEIARSHYLKRPPNQIPIGSSVSQIATPPRGTSRKRPPKPDIKGVGAGLVQCTWRLRTAQEIKFNYHGPDFFLLLSPLAEGMEMETGERQLQLNFLLYAREEKPSWRHNMADLSQVSI